MFGRFASVALAALMAGMALGAGLPARGICAHRGNDGKMPENTTLAWPNAIRLGAAMVEMDIHRCKTGELVIMHDATVDRTTNGKGRVKDMSFVELRKLEANWRNGKPIPGCPSVKIPTFDEALASIPTNANVWINCHAEGGVAVEVAKILREKGLLKKAFLASSLKAIAAARKVVPELLACNMSRPYRGADAYHKPWPPELSAQYARETVANKCQFIQLLAPCSAADAKMMHDAGVKISYFHCEKPAKVKELVDSGVDFILTDNLVPMREKFREVVR